MPELIHIIPAPVNHVHVRLVVESFDCGDECSFEHWADVRRLIDESDDTSETESLIPGIELATWN
jgi:hypothetical protein